MHPQPKLPTWGGPLHLPLFRVKTAPKHTMLLGMQHDPWLPPLHVSTAPTPPLEHPAAWVTFGRIVGTGQRVFGQPNCGCMGEEAVLEPRPSRGGSLEVQPFCVGVLVKCTQGRFRGWVFTRGPYSPMGQRVGGGGGGGWRGCVAGVSGTGGEGWGVGVTGTTFAPKLLCMTLCIVLWRVCDDGFSSFSCFHTWTRVVHICIHAHTLPCTYTTHTQTPHTTPPTHPTLCSPLDRPSGAPRQGLLCCPGPPLQFLHLLQVPPFQQGPLLPRQPHPQPCCPCCQVLLEGGCGEGGLSGCELCGGEGGVTAGDVHNASAGDTDDILELLTPVYVCGCVGVWVGE